MASSSLAPAAIISKVALPYLISSVDTSTEAQIDAQSATAVKAYEAAHPALSNRVREILWHIPWYGFKTQARLAQDSGVSPAAISRLIRGESQPSLFVALHVTQALAQRLGRPLDVSEVFSLDGAYPTVSVCHLTGCRNCLPPDAYDEEGQIKPAYQGVKSGAWSLASTTTENESANNEPATKAGETNKQKGGA